MFRIVKKELGYIVEYKTLLGWKPFVKSTGLDCAWHHQSIEYAKMNLFDEILKQTEIIE